MSFKNYIFADIVHTTATQGLDYLSGVDVSWAYLVEEMDGSFFCVHLTLYNVKRPSAE